MKLKQETLEDEGTENQYFKEVSVQLPPTANPKAFTKVAGKRNFVHYCYHDEENNRPCRRVEF